MQFVSIIGDLRSDLLFLLAGVVLREETQELLVIQEKKSQVGALRKHEENCVHNCSM